MPAGTAKTGRDAFGVGKGAARAEGLLDTGKALETVEAQRSVERKPERAAAEEANRGKEESAEPLKPRPEPHERKRGQGMDQVGAGWIVGSGAATTGR